MIPIRISDDAFADLEDGYSFYEATRAGLEDYGEPSVCGWLG